MFPRVAGKQNSLFPMGPVIKVFCYTSQLENGTNYTTTEKIIFLMPGWHTNLQQFQGARPDHVRVESSRLLFPLGVSEF